MIHESNCQTPKILNYILNQNDTFEIAYRKDRQRISLFTGKDGHEIYKLFVLHANNLNEDLKTNNIIVSQNLELHFTKVQPKGQKYYIERYIF